MPLKYILLILLLLVLIIPTVLYVGSLDWTKSHTARVAALPLFNKQADTGTYRLRVNQYEYLIRVAGMQNKGPNLILLHGFPESSIMWEALARRAARDGYRVLAFDQRGYSPGARPVAVAQYSIDTLATDVSQIADAAGFTTFHLVGHDWGAAVGWKAVMNFPERILTWTALSIPHFGAFLSGVMHDPEQKKRSSYFSFFQRPLLPEFLFTYNGQKGLKKLLATLPESHRNEYLSILAEPGALTAELNWYRAMDVKALVAGKTLDQPVIRPTLFIWGRNDFAIAPSVVAKQRPFMQGPYKEIRLNADHALMQHEEKAVIEAVMVHLKTANP
ncbi:MAG: fac-dex [Spirosoma sp.]|nr:fac-dex [Spirosoma sp.]